MFGYKYNCTRRFSNAKTWIEKLADSYHRGNSYAGFRSSYTAGLTPSLTGSEDRTVIQELSRQLVDPSSCLR
jgi:hypothetical protein